MLAYYLYAHILLFTFCFKTHVIITSITAREGFQFEGKNWNVLSHARE